MPQRSRLSTGLSGVAGEYFVAAELSRRGYIATLTLKNTRGIDILASNENATKIVGIQVKTNQANRSEWLLNQKIEVEDTGSNLFFVFISLNDFKTPSYYIVPRSEVTKHVTDGHRAWLGSPGRNGHVRKDTSMRKFADPSGSYLDKWDLLGLD